MRTRKKKGVTPPASCTCSVGPYKRYIGVAEYETPANVFHGRILGIHDIVTFEGDTPAEVAIAFRDSVDDYLDHCATKGKEPNKPFSGKFLVRVPEELHRQLSMLAVTRATSLNTLAVEGLQMRVNSLLKR